MKNLLKRFVRDERGLETVEWAVMAALITGAVIIAVGFLATAVGGKFDEMTTTIGGSTGG